MKTTYLVLLAFALASNGVADTIANISVNTSSLPSSGVFYLSFELIDGSGVGDGSNSASVSSFGLASGTTVSSPLVIGGVSGSLASGLSLTDSSPDNLILQQFSPGSTIRFTLDLTDNDDPSGISDVFYMYLLDDSFTRLATLAPSGDHFLGADFSASGTVLTGFGSDPSRSQVAIPQPEIAPQSEVPEVSTVSAVSLPLALGFFIFVLGGKTKSVRKLAKRRRGILFKSASEMCGFTDVRPRFRGDSPLLGHKIASDNVA